MIHNILKNRIKNWSVPIMVCFWIMAIILNTYNISEYMYHPDEDKKVKFIIENTDNFKHPLLLLHICRTIKNILNLSNAQTIALMGKYIMAILGSFFPVIVFIIF